MRIAERQVNSRFNDDMVAVGFSHVSGAFELHPLNVKSAIEKASKLISSYVLGVIAGNLGVAYTVPVWVPIHTLLLNILETWDAELPDAKLNVRVELQHRVIFRDVTDISDSAVRVIFVNAWDEYDIREEWRGADVCGWQILPNAIIAPKGVDETLAALPHIVEAIKAANEAERNVWMLDVSEDSASALSGRIMVVRKRSAEVMRKVMEQTLEEYKYAYSSAQTALRKYVGRRKELNELTNLEVTGTHIREHLEGMRSVPGVDGVLIGTTEMYVKFKPFEMSLPVCSDHTFGDELDCTVRCTCPISGNNCRGYAESVCSQGHTMSKGTLCTVCNEPYFGTKMICNSCGRELLSGNSNMYTVCTCGRDAAFVNLEMPAYLATVRLDRAEDSAVRIRSKTAPEGTGGAFHPHIQQDGICCWGSANGAPSYYLREGLYRELVMLISSLLHAYTPNDAYTKVTHWKKK